MDNNYNYANNNGQPPMQPGYGQPPMQPGYGQPMQPGYGQPMQPGYVQPNYNPNKPPKPIKLIDKLPTLDKIFIKQKKNIGEALTGCDLENKYYVYKAAKNKEKKSGKKIYKVKEKSSCYARVCLKMDCRPLDMKVYNQLNKDSDADDLCLFLSKPCTCTFLCCNRPTLNIYYKEDEKNEYLGKIMDPWECCNYNFVVYDETNTPIYKIIANCCQCAFWCNGCPCKACEEALIDVFDYNSKEKVAVMKKKSKNCCEQSIFDCGNYYVDFPNNATWKQKALLMSAALFIDYQIFQQNDQN